MSDNATAAHGLDGLIAVVTGAASGIGRATASLLRERGASVLIVDVDPVRVDTLVGELAADAGAREENEAFVLCEIEFVRDCRAFRLAGGNVALDLLEKVGIILLFCRVVYF